MENFQQGVPSTIVLAANKAVIPGSLALTGTITSVGKLVTGVGTLFTTELLFSESVLKYKYIYAPAQNELMEIDYVVSPTQLWLKAAFSANIAAGIVLQVANSAKSYRRIEMIDVGGSDMIIGTPNNPAVTWSVNTLYSEENLNAGLAPICVNGSGKTRINILI